MPFLSETMYRNLVGSVDSSAPDSVHLSTWPECDDTLIDPHEMDRMALAQRLVSLGRAARESADLRVRQPLAEVLFAVRFPVEKTTVEKLNDLIAAELNVKRVMVLEGAGEVVQYRLNPLPSKLGRKFGKDFPRVQKALREGAPEDVRAWARMLQAGQAVTITLDGQEYKVEPDECEVQRSAAEGYAVAEEAGYLAALNTHLTDNLILEGLAREIVRRVQTMRDADRYQRPRDCDLPGTDRLAGDLARPTTSPWCWPNRWKPPPRRKACSQEFSIRKPDPGRSGVV
jgi:isoleucyl-tRNA synthetase